MDKHDTLILFTCEYPYGSVNEPFLETEIKYLSEDFFKIVIIPSINISSFIRLLPANASIKMIEENEPTRKEKIKSIVQNLYTVILMFYYQLFIDRKWGYLKNFKSTLKNLSKTFVKADRIELLVRENNWQDCLFYDYWFENSTLVLSILKKKGLIRKSVCRAHGFDLYDERWDKKGVPYRSFKVDHFDKIFCVSKYGINYFKSKISLKRQSKLALSYLGIDSSSKLPEKSENHIFTILSCSRLIPLKRVSKVVEVLRKVKSNIHWIHLGGGDLLEEIRSACNFLPSNISWELKGQISSTSIYEFYNANFIDLFMTMSELEGLPVTIMEAISYGIPIIACNICGMPEIVNEKTGILVGKDESAENIAQIIDNLFEKYTFNRQEIINYFNNNFSAEKNYKKFIKELKQF